MRFLSYIVLALCLALTACSVDQVLTDVDLAIQMTASLETAVGNLSPDDAAVLARLVAIASDGLAAVQADYKAYEASGATTDLEKVRAVAQALQGNLAQELRAAHIANPATVQKVTAWVGLVNVALVAVLQLTAQAHSQKINPTAMAIPAPSPDVLKSRWQRDVCQGDAQCGSLVKIHKIKK